MMVMGSSLPTALARRTPTAVVLLPEPRLHVLPARPGAVLVGVTRALPLPVPARAALLARLGVLACEAVFPSPAVHRRGTIILSEHQFLQPAGRAPAQRRLAQT